jgi:site-specific DNA-cytosine methylase
MGKIKAIEESQKENEEVTAFEKMFSLLMEELDMSSVKLECLKTKTMEAIKRTDINITGSPCTDHSSLGDRTALDGKPIEKLAFGL